jgi:Peptidase C13 family
MNRLSTVLIEGLRSLVFLRVRWFKLERSQGPEGSLALVLLLGLVTLALSVLLERGLTAWESDIGIRTRLMFDWVALRLLIAEIAIPFVIAWFAFRHSPQLFVGVAMALTAWHLVFSYALWLSLGHWVEAVPGFLLVLGFNLWFMLALWVILRRGYGGVRVSSAKASLLMLPIALWIALGLVKPGPKLWTAYTPEVVGDSMAQEAVYEAQQDLLPRQLAELLPQRPDLSEYYFISFAPDASEAVFRRELDAIHPLLEERLETYGRALRLQNSAESLRKLPIATAGNLSRALMGMAKVMDRDKDVLVLYLTAHGSRGHQLSAVLDPMTLDGLNAPRLRRYLDESKIKNRVIIISACYAGGFIDALKDENTLIMTASDADHPSFGCSNESDFTYFGRALFTHGLSETVALPQAFQKAVPVIREWESKLKQGYSNPQMVLGIDLAHHLKALDERLERRATPR